MKQELRLNQSNAIASAIEIRYTGHISSAILKDDHE